MRTLFSGAVLALSALSAQTQLTVYNQNFATVKGATRPRAGERAERSPRDRYHRSPGA